MSFRKKEVENPYKQIQTSFDNFLEQKMNKMLLQKNHIGFYMVAPYYIIINGTQDASERTEAQDLSLFHIWNKDKSLMQINIFYWTKYVICTH